MRMFLHMLAFECRRMRLLLLFWLGLNLWLLHQTFSSLSEDSFRVWDGINPLLFLSLLTGSGLLLTTGHSPANPASLLRLRPLSARVITLARMGVLFFGILLPSLICTWVVYLWILPGWGTFLTATQMILLRVLTPVLAVAALGTRRNTLPDAIVLTTVLTLLALMLLGTAEFLQVTLHVQDGSFSAFIWNLVFTILIIALLLYDWFQTDCERSLPTISRRRFAALGILFFLLFTVDFKNDPVNYGHPPKTLEIKTENLEVRVTPRLNSYRAVLKSETGSSTYTNPVPSPDLQPGGTWYFYGEIEVKGLPPGIAFVTRVEESVWTPEGGNPITASFRDHNMETRFFNHRMPPPRISDTQLLSLLSGTTDNGEHHPQLSGAALFAADFETYSEFEDQTGQLQATLRLDLYSFALVMRHPFLDDPPTRTLPGERKIISYDAAKSPEDVFTLELKLLEWTQPLRTPVGSEWSSALQVLLIDERTGRELHFSGSGESGGAGFLGFSQRTLSRKYRKNLWDDNSLPLDPEHTEVVMVKPVYQGTLFIDVAVDDVRLMPEGWEERLP